MPKGAMAHRSYPSPDGKWALIVEMDDRGEFLPCRVVPMDGSSTGRQVGPLDAACLFAAWSPDGRWMYLNSASGGSLHIWRQRFSERETLAPPEQITSGPTEEEGISMAPDGRSFVTAVGLKQSSVWLVQSNSERRSPTDHGNHGGSDRNERQVSLEGQAAFPYFTPDGKKLLYVAQKGPLLGRSEIWMADLETGRNEPLLPDFLLSQSLGRPYDISPDGQHVVLQALDSEKKNRLWLVPVDRRSPPAPIPNVEGDGPIFGPDDEIFSRGREGERPTSNLRPGGNAGVVA
jgi:Tol biopolymer transport system component